MITKPKEGKDQLSPQDNDTPERKHLRETLQSEAFPTSKDELRKKLVKELSNALELSIPQDASWRDLKTGLNELYVILFAEQFLPQSLSEEERVMQVVKHYHRDRETATHRRMENVLTLPEQSLNTVTEMIEEYCLKEVVND